MSPEQVRGDRLDQRTDLFSFGLVLYEMATRQRAFPGDSAAVLHNAILNRAPVPVRELNGQVPAKLENIINKAIEKDRRVRYQTAAEIRADLEPLNDDAKPRRFLWWAAAGFTTLCVVILGLRRTNSGTGSWNLDVRLGLRTASIFCATPFRLQRTDSS
jgi:serine/threonine protein kinase